MKNRIFFLLAASLLSLTACNGTNPEDKPINEDGVSNLKATGVDHGVALTWKADEGALSYLIYKDDVQYRETDNNFFTVTNLENGVKYNLGVAIKGANKISAIQYIEATPDASNHYDPFMDELNTGLEKRIGANKIQKMFTAGNSLNDASTNVERFQKAINKMRNGISQTFAYIGGSITVGETAKAMDNKNHQKGYAYYSYSWMKEHYDRDYNSKFINASISGTDSCIATVRLEKDVLQYHPDVVFLEFAANNSTSSFDQKSYESLIRRLLLQEQKPAVILVFSAHDWCAGNINTYMKSMGSHYHIPMFSFYDAMSQVCGNMAYERTDPIFKFFTDDGTHPNDQGHKLYAKTMVYTLRALVESSNTNEYSMPNPWKTRYDDYVNFTFINNETNTSYIKSLGSYVASDTSHRVLKDTADVEAYQHGWKKTATNANDPITLEVTCKNFFIIYMAGNPDIGGDPKGKMIASYQNKNNASDKGSLSWQSDRVQKQSSISTVVDNGHGWDNPCCIILMDNADVATYTISLQMENNSGIATLLAFGYCI